MRNDVIELPELWRNVHDVAVLEPDVVEPHFCQDFLAISDLLLPAYDSYEVMIATYLAMIVPVFLGKLLARGNGNWIIA